MSLEHKSSVFVAIDNNTLYGSKLYVSVTPKIIRIIRSCSIKMFNKCPIINFKGDFLNIQMFLHP